MRFCCLVIIGLLAFLRAVYLHYSLMYLFWRTSCLNKELSSSILWLSFPLAKCGRLGVMFLKRLVVYEATYAKTATSQKGTLPSARRCRCRCRFITNFAWTQSPPLWLAAGNFCKLFKSSATLVQYSQLVCLLPLGVLFLNLLIKLSSNLFLMPCKALKGSAPSKKGEQQVRYWSLS